LVLDTAPQGGYDSGMAKRLPEDVLDYFRKQGARGGKIGGKIAAANATPAERRARATKASRAAAAARTAKRLAKQKDGR
jgi:hypothetical protein